MNKVNLTDIDVIDIAGLAATSRITDESEEEIKASRKKIMSRMSRNAADWYIRHIVTPVGRSYIQKQFDEIRNEKCQQLVIAYNEWLKNHPSQNTYKLEHIIELTNKFYELEISDFDYLENYKLIENKDTADLTINEIITLLTFYIRGENFSDDFFVNRINDGTIDKLIKCLDECTK